MTRLYVLQSGFVTPSSAELAKPTESGPSIREQIIQDTRVQDNDFYYDRGIERLYQQWRKDNNLMAQFEFREAVLRSALRVFQDGSGSIAPWMRFQLTQPTVGYLHRSFLKNLLLSICNGVPKPMENHNYFRLLQAKVPNETFNTKGENVDEALIEYLKEGMSASVATLLAQWTCTMDGFCDLLSVLHVIFGKRDMPNFVTTGVRQ